MNTYSRYSRLVLSMTASLAVALALPVRGQAPTDAEKPHLHATEHSPSPKKGASPAAADKQEKTAAKKESKEKAAAKTDVKLTRQDRAFMKKAAKGNLMEIEMGRMAQEQGKSAKVKKIGGKIAADHTKSNADLMAIASKKGVDLSKEKPKSHKISGDDFDKKYLEAMVKDHEQDIAEFEKAVKELSDADLKRHAEKTLPVLRRHLSMVKKALEKKS